MNTQTIKPDFQSMKGPELVTVYNEMVLTLIDLGDNTNAQVKRFADLNAGRRRCETLHAAIARALYKQSENAHTTATQSLVDLENSKTSDNANPPAPAGETGGGSAPKPEDVSDISWNEMTGADLSNQSEDEMKRRQKATAGRKGKGIRARTRSTNGTTIRELTEQFNSIVAKLNKGQKEAAPWAKHHTSMFESKEKAKKQLTRLKKAVGL